MIEKEILENGLIRTYSTLKVYIRKEGTEERYMEAIDLPESDFTYIETNIPLPDITN